jgi:hypothetical protein
LTHLKGKAMFDTFVKKGNVGHICKERQCSIDQKGKAFDLTVRKGIEDIQVFSINT